MSQIGPRTQAARAVKNQVQRTLKAHRPLHNGEMPPSAHEEREARDQLARLYRMIDDLAKGDFE